MLLVVDNYDSFTYNLVSLLKLHEAEVEIIKNDDISSFKFLIQKTKSLIISPGPSSPQNSKLSIDALAFCDKFDIPSLGVCLGHQLIGYYYGAKINRAPKPVHGKQDLISIINNKSLLLKNIEDEFFAARYHSLLIDHNTINKNILKTTSITKKDNLVMSIEHNYKPIYGVQFHPESIISENGNKIIGNFINLSYNYIK
jgi:anthranilate synthase component 2